MGTLSGKGTQQFSLFFSLHVGGWLLEERICSHGAHIFPLGFGLILENLYCQWRQTGRHWNWSLVGRWQRNMEGYPFTSNGIHMHAHTHTHTFSTRPMVLSPVSMGVGFLGEEFSHGLPGANSFL